MGLVHFTPSACAMTSAARIAVSSSNATRTRAPARASPWRHARVRSRGRARTPASVLLGGLAGLAAATVFVTVAPAVVRGDIDDVDRATPGQEATGRHREQALTSVASVLAPAAAVGAVPERESAEARP